MEKSEIIAEFFNELPVNSMQELIDSLKENKINDIYCFFYSQGQYNIWKKNTNDGDAYFKGNLFSERRNITSGFKSNWDDMILVGIGTSKDVMYGKS